MRRTRRARRGGERTPRRRPARERRARSEREASQTYLPSKPGRTRAGCLSIWLLKNPSTRQVTSTTPDAHRQISYFFVDERFRLPVMRFPHDSDSDARVPRPGRLPTADASSMCPPGPGRADEDDDESIRRRAFGAAATFHATDRVSSGGGDGQTAASPRRKRREVHVAIVVDVSREALSEDCRGGFDSAGNATRVTRLRACCVAARALASGADAVCVFATDASENGRSKTGVGANRALCFATARAARARSPRLNARSGSTARRTTTDGPFVTKKKSARWRFRRARLCRPP